jgi:hypothetical protein
LPLIFARTAVYHLHFGETFIQLGNQRRQAIADVISAVVRADHNGQIVSASSPWMHYLSTSKCELASQKRP